MTTFIVVSLSLKYQQLCAGQCNILIIITAATADLEEFGNHYFNKKNYSNSEFEGLIEKNAL